MKNFKIFKDTWLGLKKGWSIEILPPKIKILLSNPFVRILRFLGGLSVLIVWLQQHTNFIFPINYLIIILCILQIIQVFTINIIKIYYGIKKLIYNKKEFEVRNSPLNH